MSRSTRITWAGRFAAAVGAGLVVAGLTAVQSAGETRPITTDGVRINHAAAVTPAAHGPGFYRAGGFATYDNRSPAGPAPLSRTCTDLGNGDLCVNTRSGQKTSYIDVAYYKRAGAPLGITLSIQSIRNTPDCPGTRFTDGYQRNCSENRTVVVRAGQRHSYTGTFAGPLSGCFSPVLSYGNYYEHFVGRCAS
jgi:hypothetical protein